MGSMNGGMGGAGSFSDAGYANRAATGYKAGPGPAAPSMDSRARNSRYAQNTIASRPATVGNITTALSNAIPGVGALRTATALATGQSIDPYSGPIGRTTGYSYDGAGRFGMTGRRRATALGAFDNGRKPTLGV